MVMIDNDPEKKPLGFISVTRMLTLSDARNRRRVITVLLHRGRCQR